MHVSGERVLIFGDSLSHHGADNAPEIWDANVGSTRASGAPGDLLASMLLEAGAAAVRIDANVGRSARNFWTAPNKWQTSTGATLVTADQAFRPTKVIVMLGTNDASAGAMDLASITRIRDTYRSMGAEVIAIGPPVFASPAMTANVAKVYATLASVFPTVIDARPLSSTTGRTADGIHFQASAAKPFAQQLAAQVTRQDALVATGSMGSPWGNVAAIFGGVLGLGLLAVWWSRRRSHVLQGEKIPAWFVNPDDGEVIEVDQQTAVFTKRTRPKTLDKLLAQLHQLGIQESIFERAYEIHVSKIVVPRTARGEGIGTQAMQLLTDYADRVGKRITLTPSTDFGASSVARLKAFYKRFGFIENKGRNKDYSTRETMLRPPQEA